MAQAAPSLQQKTIRPTPKPEMWVLTLVKSKTMRFFAVSCELVIFLGCLWLTLVTILPSATGWLWGGVDDVFLVAMGFAVDAALPEAWLHVVDQWAEKKHHHLWWSIPIAIAMLLLVVANVVYAKLTGTRGVPPVGATASLVDMLLIARMVIGICYVTIRECQSFIDRKQYQQQSPSSQVLVIDMEELRRKTIDDLAEKQQQALELLRSEQHRLFTTVQEVRERQHTLQIAGPALSKDEIVNMIIERLQPLVVEQQTGQHTALVARSTDKAVERPATQTPQQDASRQSVQVSTSEIAKRPKRIDPAEVDAVVHPLLNKEQSLTHRKIAALPEISYTETVVYASVKRWREIQPPAVGDQHNNESEESGVF